MARGLGHYLDFRTSGGALHILSYTQSYPPLPLPFIVKNANQNYIFILKMEMNTIVSRVPELVSYQWKKVREK